MPNGTLPEDNYLGDGERTTGEFQGGIDQLLNYVNSLKAEVDALSSQVIREAAVRSVGTGANELPANSDLGDAAYLDIGSGLSESGESVSHADTSSQGSVNNSGNSFIQDISLDEFGHVTNISSASLPTTAGAIGTYSFLRTRTFGIETFPNDIVQGSELRYTSAPSSASFEFLSILIDGDYFQAPPGTWRCMSYQPPEYVKDEGGQRNIIRFGTLWLRIA